MPGKGAGEGAGNAPPTQFYERARYISTSKSEITQKVKSHLSHKHSVTQNSVNQRKVLAARCRLKTLDGMGRAAASVCNMFCCPQRRYEDVVSM